MSEDDESALKEEFGLQPWDMGNFMMMPEKVECPHCKEVFKTIHYSEEE